MVDKNISIYLDYLSELVQEYINKEDKESAKELLEIIKTIKAYAKILYLEERYKKYEQELVQYKEEAINKVNEELEEKEEKCHSLILEGNDENYLEIEELSKKIKDLKAKRKKIEWAFSKEMFMEKIKPDDMIIDKTTLVKNFLKCSSVYKVFNCATRLIEDGKFNMCEINFFRNILKRDFSEYSILEQIKSKESDIERLNYELSHIDFNIEDIEDSIKSYNRSVGGYIKAYDTFESLLKKEEKYQKIFKTFPILRNIIVPKEDRNDINNQRIILEDTFTSIKRSCDWLNADYLTEKAKGLISDYAGFVHCFFGEEPLINEFIIGNKKVRYHKYTDENYIDNSIIIRTYEEDKKLDLQNKISELTIEVNNLKEKIDADVAKIDPTSYGYIINSLTPRYELSKNYQLTDIVLSSLVILNYLDANFNSELVKQILSDSEYVELRSQTKEKEKVYKKTDLK